MGDLLVEQADGVLTLTLNRPDVRNAISGSLAAAVADAAESAAADDAVRVVVVRGAGPSFCAGYDLSAPGAPPDLGGAAYGAGNGAGPDTGVAADARRLARITGHWERLWHCPLPVVAQIHGHCLAGGTDLALHCDLVVVATDARIGYPPVRSLGVPPAHMWLYHLGPQWTKRLLYTGDTITGRLAAEIGFALRAVEPADLEATVAALARRIASSGREMLMANKAVVNHGLDLMGRAALQPMARLRDAVAHQAPEARAFAERVAAVGLKAAVRHRDEPFAAGEPLDTR
jgi:enoyl-CoA hydratase